MINIMVLQKIRNFHIVTFLIFLTLIHIQNSKQYLNPNIKIFDTFIYQGSDLLLQLKLQTTAQFVDYFVIIESYYHFNGAVKGLTFRKNHYSKYINQIIYFPILSLPNIGNNLSEGQISQNKQFLTNSFNKIYEKIAGKDDILILSQTSDLLTMKAIKSFIQNKETNKCIEMELYSKWFNRRVCIKGQQINTAIGPKIMTYQYLQKNYNQKIYEAFNDRKCIGHQTKDKNFTQQKFGWRCSQRDEKQLAYMLGVSEKQISFKIINISEAYIPPLLQQEKQYSKYVSLFNQQDSIDNKSKLQASANETNIQQVKPYIFGQNKRVIFDCCPYNGEMHIFLLKLRIMHYVDFFIITQGVLSYHGVPKPLVFNMNDFSGYQDKIIYVPVFKMPYLYNGNDLIFPHRRANQEATENLAFDVLTILRRQDSIVISSDIDQILSFEAFKQFDETRDEFANTQLRLFYYYFNNRPLYDHKGKKQIENFWYNGIKIITYKILRQKFGGNLSDLRKKQGCNVDVPSRFANTDSQLKCKNKLIRRAGWHFSYVLNDTQLQKKYRTSADSPSSRREINPQEERKIGVCPNCYTRKQDPFKGNLPIELLKDIYQFGQKSIFGEYIYDLKYQQFNACHDTVKGQASKSDNITVLNETSSNVDIVNDSSRSVDVVNVSSQGALDSRRQYAWQQPIECGQNGVYYLICFVLGNIFSIVIIGIVYKLHYQKQKQKQTKKQNELTYDELHQQESIKNDQ